MGLTDGVSRKDGISERTGQSRSSCIDCRDSKKVLGAFNQSSHHKGLAHTHWTDWVTSDTGPTLSCCFFSFQPVARNWCSTIIFRLLPMDSHGVHGNTTDCWLFTLTGNSYRERRRLGVNSPCFSLNSVIHLQLTEKVSGHFRLTVQWFSNSIFVLGHDPEHILVSLHQVLHGPDSFLGLICNGNPGLPARHTSPDDIVCDFGASIILWWQPSQCDLLCTDFFKLNRG